MIFDIVILTACFMVGVLFAQDHNVSLTWEPQNPKINEGVKYTISAPGAEKVRLFLNGTYHTSDGDHNTKTVTYVNRRVNYVTASALYDGVWTPKLPVKIINFSVTGRLSKVNAVVPSSIALSSSLPVSFTKIANAEEYTYCVYPVDGSCQGSSVLVKADDYSGQTISETIDYTKDLPAGEYILELYGEAPGYIRNRAHFLFEIGNSSQSLPPAPTVSIGKDRLTLGVHESANITITSEGASKARFFLSSPSNSSIHDIDDIGYLNSYFYGDSYSLSGDYSVRFSVMINGKWSAYSAPVRFTIDSNGVGPMANFSVPETVESGGILNVSIEPAANVDRYYVNVTKTGEGGSKSITSAQVTTADQPVEISLDNAEPGDYAVSVSCQRQGYEEISSYRYFTVTPSDFVLPANLTAINSYAFSNAGMKSVTIPKNVNTISAHAFENCNNLTSVSIANGPTSIGEYAFANNPKLVKVSIPNSVQSIADSAFSNCSNLTTIKAPYGSSAAEWAQSHGFSVDYN